MISFCANKQQDVKDVGKKFKLPDSEGRPGGACTSALLTVLKKHGNKEVSFQTVMLDIREQLKKKGFKQIPQLSSSRPLDVGHTKFDLVPDHYRGRKRAVMIGINYVGKLLRRRGTCRPYVIVFSHDMQQILLSTL